MNGQIELYVISGKAVPYRPDDFKQKQSGAEDLLHAGATNRRVGKGMAATGIVALIGYMMIIQGWIFQCDLDSMGSNLSVFDYMEFN